MTKINTSAMTPVIATVYELRFKVAAVKETVWNYLEDCSYEVNPGDIILNGTMGELWRVPKEKLVKKYENLLRSSLVYSTPSAPRCRKTSAGVFRFPFTRGLSRQRPNRAMSWRATVKVSAMAREIISSWLITAASLNPPGVHGW